MKLFLIAGKAGSGKNEIANIIKEYNNKTVITAFSKYIKMFTLELTEWDGKDITKPRTYLQNMGDKLRAIDSNFLTKRIYEDLELYRREDIEYVVVSDVRLINEIEYFKNIKDLDVITIRVNCNNCKRELSNLEKNHHNELELDAYDKCDYIVDNKCDSKLKEEIIRILEGMK